MKPKPLNFPFTKEITDATVHDLRILIRVLDGEPIGVTPYNALVLAMKLRILAAYLDGEVLDALESEGGE